MTKTTELWNPRKDIKGISKFTGKNARLEVARALLKYQDEKFAGKMFIPWKKFKHPELGEGEIGGPDPNRNYPSGWNLRAGNPYPMSEPCTRNTYEFMLKEKQTLHFCVLVQMDGSQGWVEFNVKSQHGGKDKKRVNIKLSD